MSPSRNSEKAVPSPSTLPWLELSTIQIRPVILYRGRFTHPYQANVTPGAHAWWYLQEGHITVEIEGRVYHIRPGEWALMPIGGKRFQKFEPGSVFISVNFVATWENGIPFLHLPAPIIRRGRDNSPLDLPALALTLCLAMDDGSGPGNIALRNRHFEIPDYLKAQSALFSFMETLIRQAQLCGATIIQRDKGDSRLELVLTSLRHAPQAGPLPFEKWQAATSLSRSQLDRLARKALGTSLHQFRDVQLLIEARKRLTTGAVIKQVSEELGFVDTSHFCRWIRRHTGHTPQQLKTLQV